MHRTALVFLCLAAPFVASGSIIDFVGAPTGVNDGSYYVTPYEVTIDGQAQLVTCFDIADNVQNGDTWQASILNLGSAASSGFFTGSNVLAGYERVAWLEAQSYSTTAQEIGLQYAIWNVFGTAPQTAASEAYEAAADAAAASGYSGFSFASTRFIQQTGAVSGAPGTYQAFVYEVAPQSESSLAVTSFSDPTAPEPGTVVLIASGIALIRFVRVRRRG